MRKTLASKVRRLLGPLIKEHGFHMSFAEGVMWSQVHLDALEFEIEVARDERDPRGLSTLIVGSKIRVRPRAHFRRFLIQDIMAYLNDGKPSRETTFVSRAKWLIHHRHQVLDVSLLNSSALAKFVRAAHRRRDR